MHKLIQYEDKNRYNETVTHYICGNDFDLDEYDKTAHIPDHKIIYSSEEEFRFVVWHNVTNRNEDDVNFPTKVDKGHFFFMIIRDDGVFDMITSDGVPMFVAGNDVELESIEELRYEMEYLISMYDKYGVKESVWDYSNFPEFADGFRLTVCGLTYQLFSDVDLDKELDSTTVLTAFDIIDTPDVYHMMRVKPNYITDRNTFENGTWNLVIVTLNCNIPSPVQILSDNGVEYDHTLKSHPNITRTHSFLGFGFENERTRKLLAKLIGLATVNAADSLDSMGFILTNCRKLMNENYIKVEILFSTRSDDIPSVYHVELEDYDGDPYEEYYLIDTKDRVIAVKEQCVEVGGDWPQIYESIVEKEINNMRLEGEIKESDCRWTASKLIEGHPLAYDNERAGVIKI